MCMVGGPRGEPALATNRAPETCRVTALPRLAFGWRPVLWVGFFALILLGWTGLWIYATPAGTDLMSTLLALCGPAGGMPFPTLWAMWALMVLAMMLPGFAPAFATWIDIAETGADTLRQVPALVGGYLIVWLVAVTLFAGAQVALGALGLAWSPWLAPVLLIGAGLWQFSGTKAACLTKCRHPLTYFMGRWRPGLVPALRMGAELGLICLGCCWALMALALIGGAMSLAIMAAATVLMALEKLPGPGRVVTPVLASGLLFAGGATALGLF
jgi:predicted metal-binding membrane protein